LETAAVAVVAAVAQVQEQAPAVAATRLRLVAHPPVMAPHAEPAVVVVVVVDAVVAPSNRLFCIV
jgi:hypothetical protein